jgi:hypothetical protein
MLIDVSEECFVSIFSVQKLRVGGKWGSSEKGDWERDSVRTNRRTVTSLIGQARLFCKSGGRNNSSEETNGKWRDDKDDGVKETFVLISLQQR